MAIKDKIIENLPDYQVTLTAAQLKTVNDHIISVLASPNFSIPAGYESLEDFLRKFPDDFITEAREDAKGRFLDFINLFDKVELRITDIPILKLKRSSGLNSEDVDLMKAQFEEFIKEQPELADKLITYSFLTNGFRFNQNSFSHLIPVSYYKENRGVIESVDKVADNLSEEMVEAIAINVIKNNPFKFTPLLTPEAYESVDTNTILINNGPVDSTKKPVKFINVMKEDPKDGTTEFHLYSLIKKGAEKSAFYMRVPRLGVRNTFMEFTNFTNLSENRFEYSEQEMDALLTHPNLTDPELKLKRCE